VVVGGLFRLLPRSDLMSRYRAIQCRDRAAAPLAEPARPPSHWDHLLAEARRMQADMRAEQKLRMGIALRLARACQRAVQARERDAEVSWSTGQLEGGALHAAR